MLDFWLGRSILQRCEIICFGSMLVGILSILTEEYTYVHSHLFIDVWMYNLNFLSQTSFDESPYLQVSMYTNQLTCILLYSLSTILLR